jgi:hypothetical protein
LLLCCFLCLFVLCLLKCIVACVFECIVCHRCVDTCCVFDVSVMNCRVDVAVRCLLLILNS